MNSTSFILIYYRRGKIAISSSTFFLYCSFKFLYLQRINITVLQLQHVADSILKYFNLSLCVLALYIEHYRFQEFQLLKFNLLQLYIRIFKH